MSCLEIHKSTLKRPVVTRVLIDGFWFCLQFSIVHNCYCNISKGYINRWMFVGMIEGTKLWKNARYLRRGFKIFAKRLLVTLVRKSSGYVCGLCIWRPGFVSAYHQFNFRLVFTLTERQIDFVTFFLSFRCFKLQVNKLDQIFSISIVIISAIFENSHLILFSSF